jgi:hypothetical protein
MSSIIIPRFKGKRPKSQPELLEHTEAQVSINCDFDSGGIKPFNNMSIISTLSGGVVTDSALNNVTDSALNNVTSGQANFMYLVTGDSGSSIWLGFTDNDLDIIPATIDNTDGRFYYTGDGRPSQSNYTLATTGTVPPYPGVYYRLGIPAPTTKLTYAVVNGGTGTEVSTAYVYTYVTVWGEESAPSPTTENFDVDFLSGDTVTLSDFLLPTDTDLNIDAIRIYRINSGTATSEYQFIEEVPCDNTLGVEEINSTPVGSYTYSDNTPDADLGESIITEGWLQPPSDMLGLSNILQSSLAGYTSNTLHISEPFYPYAWPSKYEIDLPYNIRGVASAVGRTYVLTTGVPYIGSGIDPDTFSVQPLPFPQPCVAHRSIVTTDMGVIYASQQGLFMLQGEQGILLTEDIFTEQQWRELDIASINGVFYKDSYYGIFNDTCCGFIFNLVTKDWTDIELTNQTMSYITTDGTYVYVTARDDINYIYSSYAWDEGTGLLPVKWKSKIFKQLTAANFSIARLLTDGTIYFQYWIDGQMHHIEVATEDLFRLPAGVRGHEIEVGLEGKSETQAIMIANSVQEMVDG